MFLVVIVGSSWSLKGFIAAFVLLNQVGEYRDHVSAGTRLDITVHVCSADFSLWHYNCGKGLLVIIILLLLHSSPDGTHPIPPILYFHISLSSSVSPHHLILSLQRADKNRERETARNREMARKQKTRIRWKQTDIHREVEAEREKEDRGVVFLTFEILCNHWPLVSQYPVKICLRFICCSSCFPSSSFFHHILQVLPFLSGLSLSLPWPLCGKVLGISWFVSN